MTNYEKNKELLDMYAASGIFWGVDKDGKIFDCISACHDDCIFVNKSICSRSRFKWLQQEYKEEPEVDWSKVEIDTPILVRNNEDSEWGERYFAGYINGKVCTFNHGKTSEDFEVITHWNYAKLAEEEEEND